MRGQDIYYLAHPSQSESLFPKHTGSGKHKVSNLMEDFV